MTIMRKYKYITTLLLVTVFFSSCNEDEWLTEEIFDFYTPENSYTTPEQFNSAVARIYETVDNNIMWSQHTGNYVYHYTSDIAYDAIDPTHALNSYIDKIMPEDSHVGAFWQRYYQIVSEANVVIQRIDGEDIEFPSEAERNVLKAEAMFLRAYAYRNLGIQYGGVPIILEELSAPKRDFVRATREVVWAQCIADLEFAVTNLPEISGLNEDGRLTKGAANHLIAELYIITGEYDKAIAAASAVIDNPDYALMTGRFGTRQDEPGDVYWDLFRRGNHNRNGGINTEAIWVAQYEYLAEGGGRGSNLPRFLVPQYKGLTGASDGLNLFIGPSNHNGGRGIGWMAPSKYYLEDLWVTDPNDMRNSEHNIIRDIAADNPESAYYGQKIVESGALANSTNAYNRDWSAIVVKGTPINNFPAEAVLDAETGLVGWGASNAYRDFYYMRLAETYLLRAEAYLGKNDQGSAAADINVVRERANATLVAAGDVDIDYILDERARELGFEELRILTLMRLGKLAERVKLHDPMHNGLYASNGVEEYHNIWPIPQSEIERNTEAVLEQNPGYN